VHSGDSIAVSPPYHVDDDMLERIVDCSKKLAVAFDTRGLVNIQYLIYQDELYVIEVNPRASRTIPYISKVTGVQMVDIATRAMLGETLAQMGCGTGLHPVPPYTAVKVPVFSFEKLTDVDTQLGPEMKSTGEALGLAATFSEALYKGLVAAGYDLKKKGGVFFSVKMNDRSEIVDTAKRFREMDFTLYATRGNAAVIRDAGLWVTEVDKIHENPRHNVLHLLESGAVDYVVSTSAKGRLPSRDSVKIRRKAVERRIPCLTAIDTANAVAMSIKSGYSLLNTELVNINHMRKEHAVVRFTKMQGTGNDFIYFNCFTQRIYNPQGLAVRLSTRHYGVGGDGVVLILPSQRADAALRMYNRDGPEGLSAGNALRCVAKYLYDNKLVHTKDMKIETASGVRSVHLHMRNGEVVAATVDMGKPRFAPAQIPVKLSGSRVVDQPIEIGGREYRITCVDMGNPHAVVFVDDVIGLKVKDIGPLFENNPLFPERVNTEFIKVLSPTVLRMRVWERGSGETYACGSGACAAVVAAVINGHCPIDTDITVKLKGGELSIRYTGESVMMRGDAQTVFEGTVKI
jgi:carbamoyl-phosphate synthase large subunit